MRLLRPNQFHLMLSNEEKRWLKELADNAGLTASDFLRQYIRDANAILKVKVKK